VSLVLATQHPTNAAFGNNATIKRNVPGRIALRVSDAKSSEVAIGQSTPRADWLLGAGDAYAVVPGAVQRLQIAFLTRTELDRLQTGVPELVAWPEFSAESIGQMPVGNVAIYSGAELAVSLINARDDGGRPALVKALESSGLGKPGNVRADRLLRLGRDQLTALRSDGWSLCRMALAIPANDDDGGLPA
jgi:DNA segregation ATPase FtsK/SpoIIIE-like protein